MKSNHSANIQKFRERQPEEFFKIGDATYSCDDLSIVVNEAKWSIGDLSGEFPHGLESGIEQLTEDKKLCVLYGVGDGEYLLRLLKVPTVKQYLVFEPSLSVFENFMQRHEASLCLADLRVEFIVGSSTESYIKDVERYFLKMIDRFCYAGNFVNLVTPGVQKIKAYQTYFVKFAEAFKHAANNIRSLSHFSKEDSLYGLANALMNFSSYRQFANIDAFQNCFKSVPCVVVAPGPSLQMSLLHLKEIQNKVVIVSCDTAVPALQQAGVKPHFICSLEREPEIGKVVSRIGEQSGVYVIPSVVSPAALENYRGPKVAIARDTGFDGWLFPKATRHFLGQTVSQMCLRVAAILGSSEIHLIGVDCAFDPVTDQSHHGSVEERIEEHSEWIKNESDYTVFEVPGYDGKPKKTWTIWYVDSKLIEKMIFENHLNVKRVTPENYGIPFLHTERLDPLAFKVQAEKWPHANVASTIQNVLENVKVATTEASDFFRESMVRLKNFKTECHDLLYQANSQYYRFRPREKESKNAYREFFNFLSESNWRLTHEVQGCYLMILHNILQGSYAENGFQIERIASEIANPTERIQKTLEHYRGWFSEMVLWTDRVIYLLEKQLASK